jgi:RNA polymerase sigma factor (sigma-70 family)
MEPDSERREWVLAALGQFEARLLRYAKRLIGGSDAGNVGDESRDVVQFVFLRLCDQSSEKIGDRLAQWLYTVCRNRALDVLRASGRNVGWAKAAAADDPPSSNGKPVGRRSRCELDPPYSRECDPADSAEEAELHALLRELVAALPASQREAIDLWSDGFSYQQIAEITSQKEGTIRVLVHRGLKALREHPQVRALMNDESTLARSASEGKPIPSPVHGASPN